MITDNSSLFLKMAPTKHLICSMHQAGSFTFASLSQQPSKVEITTPLIDYKTNLKRGQGIYTEGKCVLIELIDIPTALHRAVLQRTCNSALQTGVFISLLWVRLRLGHGSPGSVKLLGATVLAAVSERLACKGLPLTIPVTPPPGVPRHPPLGGSKMPATLRTVPFPYRHGYKEKKITWFPWDIMH